MNNQALANLARATHEFRKPGWLVFGCALIVRLLICFAWRNRALSGNTPEILSIVESLLHGRGFVVSTTGEQMSVYGPVYPLFLALIRAAFGTGVWKAQLCQCVLDSATAALVWRIGWHLLNNQVGLLAGLLYAIHPIVLNYTTNIIPEPLFTFCLAWAALSLLNAKNRNRTIHFVFAGAVLGLATLCRGTTFVFPAFTAVWLLDSFPWRRALRMGVIYTIAFAAVVGIWTYRNWKVFGGLIPVTANNNMLWYGSDERICLTDRKGQDWAAAENLREWKARGLPPPPGHEIAAWEKYYKKLAFANYHKLLQENPWKLVTLYLKKTARVWYATEDAPAKNLYIALLQFPLLLLAFLGGRTLWRNKYRAAFWFCTSFVGYFFLLHVIVHPLVRYMEPCLLFLFILAVCAFPRLLNVSSSGTDGRQPTQ